MNFRLLHLCVAITLVHFCSPYRADAQSESTKMQDEISYSNDIQPIVKNFCTTCHAGKAPQGDFVLTSYADVRKHVEHGELLKRINDEADPMPQNGLLPKYMRRIFQLWADGGYVEQGKRATTAASKDYGEFKPPQIKPVDVRQQGFELLEKMQGHWVGNMNLMGQKLDWMAFDYRAIAPSHVHGIFEGGTIGNLFTSFFVTKFNGTQTIFARNGGLLNGIYRTSYFVLDQVKYGRGWSYYRLVDARGGKDIMWMELTFYGNSLEFNSYTSRFGLTEPKLHMAFKATRKNKTLAAEAAKAVRFPQNSVDFDFSKGLPKPNWPEGVPLTSASYVWEEEGKTLLELGKIARDPYRINQIPHLSKLTVSAVRDSRTQGKKLHIYLSRLALTDAQGRFKTQGGYVRLDLLDTLLSFPEISAEQDSFTFTYLHPGSYFLTMFADVDGDGYPSPGDITHPVKRVVVKPETHAKVLVKDLRFKN